MPRSVRRRSNKRVRVKRVNKNRSRRLGRSSSSKRVNRSRSRRRRRTMRGGMANPFLCDDGLGNKQRFASIPSENSVYSNCIDLRKAFDMEGMRQMNKDSGYKP